MAAVIPGTTSKSIPAAASASHASPPRPKTNGSPPLGYERRLFERKEVQMPVHARRHDHSINAHLQPLVRFEVRDVSRGGCSALADAPLDAGEHLTIFFPSNPMSRPWDAYGRVVR